MRVAPQIILTDQDRSQLETLATAPETPAKVAQRARIILLAAQGEQNKMIAPRLGIGRAQVARWRERYAHAGLGGILHDLPRGAPPVRVDMTRLARLTGADGPDAPRGWSMRGVAAELGVSAASVSRHWRAAGLASGFTGRATGPTPFRFSGRAVEIVALYAAGPEHALVLAFDEHAHPLADGGTSAAGGQNLRSLPAHQRSLAASLLTALRMLDGGIGDTGAGGGQHESWLGFLRDVEAATPADRHIWVLSDNYASHQHADVQHWVRRHPRVMVQLAPNGAAWLRMVQRFLCDAQTVRRSSFPAAIPEALAAIEAAARSRSATPYRWIRQTVPHGLAGGHALDMADAPDVPQEPQGTSQLLPPGHAVAEGERPILPITSTKVLPPRGARQLMPREALMGRLLDARRHRCVMIQGQAGSGKTSTLMAWRKAMISLGYDVCWLSLAAEDNEPARFLDYLLASIAEADPAAAREASQVVAAGQVAAGHDAAEIELWAITLVQGLARRQRELVLMIDDLHHVSDPAILLALQWLLEYAPPQLHVALASRTALDLSMERLRLQNQLAEFDMRDLRFSPEESARYLRDQLGSISGSDAAALHALTDGWAAGLQLFAIGLRTRQAGSYPVTQVRDARAFASFFEREVLVRLAPDDLDMLTRVAICQRFCVPLCAEILGQPQAAADIKARVARMVADHLFITVVGSHDNETWYRIHPLLRETLLGYLAARDEAEIRALHATAWRWFDARGHLDEAVLHAVSAGEPDAAATLVEGRAQALLVGGELSQVAGLLRMLPEEQVRGSFRLHVAHAYMLLYARDFDGLRRSLDEMDAQRASLGAAGCYTVSLLRAGMALQLDDIDAAAALLPEIWNAPPDAGDFTWLARANALSWLLIQRGEHDLARGILEEADLRSRSPRSRQFGRCVHALSLVREGQIRQACKIVREVLAEAEGCGAGYVAMASMAAGLLADALYELNETEAACQLLEPRIGMVERTSLPEVVLRASLVLSNSHWIAGRRQQALACLDRLEAYAVRYGLDRLLAEALVQRLRRHLQQGAMERASIVLECVRGLAQRHTASGSGSGSDSGSDSGSGSGPERARALAHAAERAAIDMALHTRDFAGALERIQPLLDASEQGPATASLRLQLAVARQGLGEGAAARQDFVAACRLGHGLGLSRTLLDALEVMSDATDTLVREPLPDPVLGFYVQRLLAAHRTAASDRGAADAGPQNGPIALLSEREREILYLLAQAMSNKKIARVLNVSAETVKWHLKNIYAKLGVGGRGGAAALLRDVMGPGVVPA